MILLVGLFDPAVTGLSAALQVGASQYNVDLLMLILRVC